ncbi:MAG: phage tail sheath subtilisin-like domain-containing protein [Hyphomicrobium sp.]
MPEYLHPGVYVEETSYRGKPIQGVSTSTAGFVGAARKGPEGRATFIPSFAAFQRLFGEPVRQLSAPGDFLGHSVRSFFENGGARCYVVRALAADALASATTIERGIVLRLARGVTVRGPTRTLRLNALRGVGAGTVLNVFTRPDENSAFAQTRTLTVESYDALRDTITVDAASEVPNGVALEPANTVILINGSAPASATTVGGGATFTAKNRGVDGDAIAVELRPRDRPPVALTTASAARQDPALDIEAASLPLVAGAVALQFTTASLRRLRTGDTISVGASSGLVVQAIADGEVDFAKQGGGVNLSGGGTMRLISRGGDVLARPIDLGAAPAGIAIDMTPAGPFSGALPHDLAAFLQAGDVVEVDDGGGNTGNIDISATRVAQEIAAGDHTTVAPGLAQAEAGPVEARVTATASVNGMVRLYVGNVTGFVAPQRAGSAEPVAVTDGITPAGSEIVLVDLADNAVYLTDQGAGFPDAAWSSVEGLQAAADGDTAIRVASTAGIYSGAKVEIDTGDTKVEALVATVDAGARVVNLTAGLALGAGNTIDVPPDRADRRAFIRVCEVDVVVFENGVIAETFEGLTWNPDDTTDAGLRYWVTRINDPEIGSDLVSVVEGGGAGTDFAEAPVVANGLARSFSGGSNGSALTDVDLIGTDLGPGRRTGIQALSERDDISMVAVPGVTSETVQGALITHSELLKYRVAVLDCPASAGDVTELQAHRNNYDSKYAAYYAPWLKALNPLSGRIENFPPSAYAMGIYARSDNSVGVHKAPANEVVRNITDVALPFTAAEQDVLNPVGINLIRDLTPRGLRMWGARTISSDQEWKYLNIRRLFIYVEHSIDIGTQWVVFEPNSESLWARVVETVTSFLIGVWKSGALMGTTPEDAFFVTCDRTTMTQDDIDNGRLVCKIGLAPVAPAEFVIFRIGQFTASANT